VKHFEQKETNINRFCKKETLYEGDLQPT